LSPLSR